MPRINVHKLFAKALLMEKREKVDILMPRTQEDREKEIKEMWSDLPNQGKRVIDFGGMEGGELEERDERDERDDRDARECKYLYKFR